MKVIILRSIMVAVTHVNDDIVGVLWCAESASRPVGLSSLHTLTVTPSWLLPVSKWRRRWSCKANWWWSLGSRFMCTVDSGGGLWLQVGAWAGDQCGEGGGCSLEAAVCRVSSSRWWCLSSVPQNQLLYCIPRVLCHPCRSVHWYTTIRWWRGCVLWCAFVADE